MQLKEIMSRDVNGVRPDASIIEAIQSLRGRDGEPLPVYDDGHLVGVITEHNVLQWEAQGRADLNQARVRDVMERDIAACYEDQDVNDALQIMKQKGTNGLVVLRRSNRPNEPLAPVGVVSPVDVAQKLPIINPAYQTRQNANPLRAALPARISASSILGLFSFACAMFVISTYMAGWYGTPASPLFLFPFVGFMGIVDWIACRTALRNQNALGAAIYGTFGAFFLGYGLMYLLVGTHTLALPTTGLFQEFGFWFIALAAVSWITMLCSVRADVGFATTLGILAIGCTLAAIAFIVGQPVLTMIAGWVLFVSSLAAWILGGYMLYISARGLGLLPANAYPAPGINPTNPPVAY